MDSHNFELVRISLEDYREDFIDPKKSFLFMSLNSDRKAKNLEVKGIR